MMGVCCMDKSKQFLLKIQSKNQLRVLLKQKKAEYSKALRHPELLDEVGRLKEEISSIELELAAYD